jgi:5-(carboxyamino)imidazole ribonucleotide mutase
MDFPAVYLLHQKTAELGLVNTMKKVAVIMGSDSDLPVVEKAFAVLDEYGVPYEAHVMSAHRTPEAVASFVKSARANGFGVIIAAAGMAAHLAGVCAASTTLPVIGIPVRGGMLDGLDALLSTVQMPTGIPVATVAMNGAANAALLACEMIALSDDALAEKLDNSRVAGAEKVYAKDAALQEKLK